MSNDATGLFNNLERCSLSISKPCSPLNLEFTAEKAVVYLRDLEKESCEVWFRS